MKMIWATWRKNYIQNTDSPKDSCIFCQIALEKTCDAKNLVLYRGNYNFVLMNLFPYTSGHLLIVPYRHIPDYKECTPEEILEMGLLEQKAIGWLESAFHPQGYNLGMNLGKVAGAGIDNHIHRHIVPRWKGDSNFLPTIGETRVMSISIEDAYQTLSNIILEEIS